MDLETLLQEYFTKNKLMQLATVSEGKPWMCNVYFATDDEHNIYWTSSRKRQHSKEIHADPHVAAVIVHSEDDKQALQITGLASEVPLDDVKRVHDLLGEKIGHKPSRLEEALANTPDGRAYWVLKPTQIFFWDEVNFPDSPKQEFKLT